MIIRKQLWFSNFITIIITIFLLIIVSILIGRSYQNISRFGLLPKDFVREEVSRGHLDLLEREIRTADKIVNRVLRENPEALEDIKYIQQLDAFMNASNSGIIIRKNNEILYYSPFLSSLDLDEETTNPQIQSFPNKKIIDFSENIYLEKLDFRFPDESEGEILIVSDVTSTLEDLKRTFEETRKQLKETEKIKRKYDNNRNELISNISHDLKTPITTIKGYIEGIIDGIPSSKEKKDKYLKTIYQNTVNMESLINELFLLSELELKELPLNFVPIDITAYLTDCVEELKFYLAEKGIILKFDADYNEQEKVCADRDKIKRVILNIINNAVNYKASIDPVITIQLTEKKEEAQIEIRDNGQGIPEKSLNNIFERFYKADKARSINSSGTGLGLYIAKEIIMSHEGKIWAKSQEGKGSSIFFTLKKTHYFSKMIKTEKKQ